MYIKKTFIAIFLFKQIFLIMTFLNTAIEEPELHLNN